MEDRDHNALCLRWEARVEQRFSAGRCVCTGTACRGAAPIRSVGLVRILSRRPRREAEDARPVNLVFSAIFSEGHRRGSISLRNKSSGVADIAVTNLLLSTRNGTNTSPRDLAVSFFSRTGINIDSVRVRDSRLKF